MFITESLQLRAIYKKWNNPEPSFSQRRLKVLLHWWHRPLKTRTQNVPWMNALKCSILSDASSYGQMNNRIVRGFSRWICVFLNKVIVARVGPGAGMAEACYYVGRPLEWVMGGQWKLNSSKLFGWLVKSRIDPGVLPYCGWPASHCLLHIAAAWLQLARHCITTASNFKIWGQFCSYWCSWSRAMLCMWYGGTRHRWSCPNYNKKLCVIFVHISYLAQ